MAPNKEKRYGKGRDGEDRSLRGREKKKSPLPQVRFKWPDTYLRVMKCVRKRTGYVGTK